MAYSHYVPNIFARLNVTMPDCSPSAIGFQLLCGHLQCQVSELASRVNLIYISSVMSVPQT